MPKLIKSFSKYHGAGNDFILLEDFKEEFSYGLIPRFCNRHLGIGADGLILIRRSKIADFEMVYFNSDGSKAAMCGNGLRCFVHFLRDSGIIQSQYLVEVAGEILKVKCEESKIFTFLPKPRILYWDLKLGNHSVFVVNTGVPHAVIFASEDVDVLQEGKSLCHHEMFQPEGVNVNFVEIVDSQLRLNTFERGVEKVTLACGTGVAAAAFVATQLNYCGNEIQVITRSKEKLNVRIGKEIEITGPSVKVFDGQISL